MQRMAWMVAAVAVGLAAVAAPRATEARSSDLCRYASFAGDSTGVVAVCDAGDGNGAATVEVLLTVATIPVRPQSIVQPASAPMHVGCVAYRTFGGGLTAATVSLVDGMGAVVASAPLAEKPAARPYHAARDACGGQRLAFKSPKNDDFADAKRIREPAFTASFDSARATREPHEAGTFGGVALGNCAGEVQRSVWYRVDVASTATYVVDTAGSTYDTVVAFWQPSASAPQEAPAEMTNVACNDDARGDHTSRMVATLAPGTYWLQVSEFWDIFSPVKPLTHQLELSVTTR